MPTSSGTGFEPMKSGRGSLPRKRGGVRRGSKRRSSAGDRLWSRIPTPPSCSICCRTSSTPLAPLRRRSRLCGDGWTRSVGRRTTGSASGTAWSRSWGTCASSTGGALRELFRRVEAGGSAVASLLQALDQSFEHLALDEDVVCAGSRGLVVDCRALVAREGDQADERMCLAQLADRGDAVHVRHVQVDDDGVGAQLVGQVDRLDPVVGERDDGQLGLLLDQHAQSRGVPLVVVREQYADRSEVRRSVHSPLVCPTWKRDKRFNRSPSSAQPSISEPAGGAWTWARRRSGTPGWRRGSANSGANASTWGTCRRLWPRQRPWATRGRATCARSSPPADGWPNGSGTRGTRGGC